MGRHKYEFDSFVKMCEILVFVEKMSWGSVGICFKACKIAYNSTTREISIGTCQKDHGGC